MNILVFLRLGEHLCEVSPWSVQPFWRRRFLDFSGKSNMAAKPLIGCSVICLQLWRHNEGTCDIKEITVVPHEKYLPCAKFQFFSLCSFRNTGGLNIFLFSNMASTPRDLWRHHCHQSTIVVAPEVKILSQSDKQLQRKTLNFCVDKQTNNQTRQTNRPKCNTLSSGEDNNKNYDVDGDDVIHKPMTTWWSFSIAKNLPWTCHYSIAWCWRSRPQPG